MVNFNVDKDIPDLSGKVILVTGGNIGLGYESILQLSKHRPAHIFLAARSKDKADAAIAELKRAVPDGAPITFLPLDLASFESIKSAAKTFQNSSDRLDILMNNAGIMACPPGLTREGYEIQFGTNHVGHALLTELLLPTLKRTASSGHDVRVVNLSSGAHIWAPKTGYLLDQVRTEMRSTSTFARYGQSKLANIHWTRYMAERHPELLWTSLHPGSVRTNLISGPAASYPLLSPFFGVITRFITVSVQTGALGQLWASVAPKTDLKQGAMYYPVGRLGCENDKAKDDVLMKELGEWTDKELKAHL